ncbi:hypothetical protein EV363DRAFT_1403300 [Boletus edulis]|nr:hypothetical protein EV363DRAFT_1403300 [Boletus edulis]
MTGKLCSCAAVHVSSAYLGCLQCCYGVPVSLAVRPSELSSGLASQKKGMFMVTPLRQDPALPDPAPLARSFRVEGFGPRGSH